MSNDELDEEGRKYAAWLGLTEEDRPLWRLVKIALNASLPPPWERHTTTEGDTSSAACVATPSLNHLTSLS